MLPGPSLIKPIEPLTHPFRTSTFRKENSHQTQAMQQPASYGSELEAPWHSSTSDSQRGHGGNDSGVGPRYGVSIVATTTTMTAAARSSASSSSSSNFLQQSTDEPDLSYSQRFTSDWQHLQTLNCGCSGFCGVSGFHVEIRHLKHSNFALEVVPNEATSGGRKRYSPLPKSVEDPEEDYGEEGEEEVSGTKKPWPRCMVGPHWWLMALAFVVLATMALMVLAVTLPRASAGEIVAGIILCGGCLSMYALVACTDPGIVKRQTTPPGNSDSYSYCDYCDSYRPAGAFHCMDCRVCIEEYDHHCPWTGKCIGKGNVCYFYLWLFSLVLAFVFEIIEFTMYLLPPERQPLPYNQQQTKFNSRLGNLHW